MDDATLIQQASQVLVHTYNRPELVFSHGQGCTLYDTQGRQYLDLTSGIAVNALGHADPEWVSAVQQAASQLTHVSNLYHSAPHIELATSLVHHSFADRVFFCNSGTEANEAAIKFARKWAKTHHSANKTRILAFTGGFHGRTLGALSVTEKPAYRTPFAPLLPDIDFAPYNDLAAAQALITAETSAVIVEPIQGEGGVHPATQEFLAGLRAACDAHHALLIFDEVQCGLGRTGQLWAYEHYAITPDVLTLAKPLANGLPIGAVLVTQAVASAMQPGDHGSTFAGGPLVCSAAQVVLNRVTAPDFLGHVQQVSAHLLHGLQTLESDAIREVRGLGLLLGVELDRPVADLITTAREHGLLLISAGENVLRFAPPLIIETPQIDTALGILQTCLP